MFRRMREIGEILASDLGWIDPRRRRVFVEGLARERESYLDVILADPAGPDDLPAAREVARQLRAEPGGEARADALEAWARRARDA